jgi:serine/threonine protein kinase/outer membrane protein assembly factor BamB
MAESSQPFDSSSLTSTRLGANSEADALVNVLDEYLAALQAGKAPAREELLARYPELSAQLESLLAGIDFIHGVEKRPDDGRRIGDFRIVREVGRGGMGAVYEAEQLSLRRRVALKVLRFGGVSDREAIERFRREAETVAKLHHTNIVPIFAVGSEQGVNYYAMQFIEGRSLADVIAQHSGQLSPHQVAEWGLQAADALAHAHQRGVVHRDVKPSNLLLDEEGRLWLTDFGLACRQDDITLSLTGALLGTPRYMSPEQASATTKRVDQRSDLFSLGATLYELITSRPAFTGNTPHDVIQQILSSEPTPIRQFQRSCPRDLETIIMKCLAKAPAERYASAADLAADLRAFLDGRPIRARRSGVFERAARWVKKHQRSVRQSGIAVASTLFVTLGAALGWMMYQNANLSSIQLSADDPPLVAEIIDKNGNTSRVETLPMQNAASLPAGQYQLRVSRPGMLSQTLDAMLDAGQQNLQYTLSMQNELLVPPRIIERTFDVAPLADCFGIVELTNDGLTINAKHGMRHSLTLAGDQSVSSLLSPFPGYCWRLSTESVSENSGYGTYALQPWIVKERVDANQDGVPDVILAARHQAWLMAVSGKGDGILWFAARSEQLSQAKDEGNRYADRTIRSAILSDPIVLNDQNADGVPELLVSLVEIPLNATVQQNTYECRRWLEAVSGRDGAALWRYELPEAMFALSAGQQIPYAMRWYPDVEGGRTGNGAAAMQFGRHAIRGRARVERTGAHVYRPDGPHLIEMAGQSRVAVVAARQLILLDPVSGKPIEAPIDLNVRPGRAVQWAELDGDGATDLVILEEVANVASPREPLPSVHAWSNARRTSLWSHRLTLDWPGQALWTADAPQWPVVADLDLDGKSEVILPFDRSPLANVVRGTGGAFNAKETPWCALAVLHGDSGSVRWTRRLVTMDVQVDQFDAGPDINGDGTREVFAATLAGPESTLYVDALDGINGEILWSASQPLPDNHSGFGDPQVADVTWWGAAPKTEPQLLVRTVREHGGERESNWYAFDIYRGMLSHWGEGITDLTPADIDGDGLDDLLVYVSKSALHRDRGGTLHVVRGVARVPWTRLGDLGDVIGDVNSDGVQDLVRSWGDGTLVTTNGATGEQLWRARPVRAVDQLVMQSAYADLDGDGASDLLGYDRSTGGRGRVSPLHAISGRNGALLWSISDVAVRMIGGSLAMETKDLDADGRPEILWLAAVDHQYPDQFTISTLGLQLWLFAADGRTGRLRWSRAMSPAYGQGPGSQSPYQFQNAQVGLEFADLDGNGVLDVLTPAIASDGSLELRAIDGKQGETLWRRPRPADHLSQLSLMNATGPTVCDFEGDGVQEVVVVEPGALQQPSGASYSRQDVVVTALRASSGEPLWTAPTGAVYTHFHSFSKECGELLRPRIMRATANQHLVAVYLPGGDERILVFGPRGKVAEREVHFSGMAPGLRICDVQGDGDDELVFVDQGSLHVAAPDRLDAPIWSRDLNVAVTCQYFEVLPTTQSSPAIIAIAPDPADNTLLGIEASSGSTVWSCPGPIPRSDNTINMLEQLELLGSSAAGRPLVYFAHGYVGCCREAVARKPFLEGTSAGRPAILSVTHRPVRDARWQRDLPWRIDMPGTTSRHVQFFAWATFFSVTLVLLPGGYLAWLLARRRFGMSSLLMLPVVAGTYLSAALVEAPVDNDFGSVLARTGIGVMVAPNLVSAAMLAGWLFAGRWPRVLVWLGVLVAVGCVLGAAIFWSYTRNSPLLPEESFDWSTWYQILLPAAYATACLVLFATGIEWLLRRYLSRRQLRRHERTSRQIAEQTTLAVPDVEPLHRSEERTASSVRRS